MDADKGFHRVIAGGHRFKQRRQVREWTFTIDKVAGVNDSGFDVFEGAANRARRVMEAREQSEV